MPATKRYNWLVIAVAALLLINIATLAFLWLGKPKENATPVSPRGDAKDFIVTQLQLNAGQQKQFDSLRTIHFGEMNAYRQEMKKLKDALFHKLKQPEDSSYKDLAQEIGSLQTQMDLSTFHHFQALRAICMPEQQQKFDGVIQDVLRNLGRPMGGPGGHHPEGRPPFDGPPGEGLRGDSMGGRPPGPSEDGPPAH